MGQKLIRRVGLLAIAVVMPSLWGDGLKPQYYDQMSGGLFIPGIDVDDLGPQDAVFQQATDPQNFRFELTHLDSAENLRGINHFNGNTQTLFIDGISVGPFTYEAQFPLVQTNPTVFGLGPNRPVVDLCQPEAWDFNFNNGFFPNNPIMINCDGTALLDNAFAGSVAEDQDVVELSFGGGLTFFRWARPRPPNLCVDNVIWQHFGQMGSNGRICPGPGSETLALNGNRFQVNVDWQDGPSSGTATGTRITEDSGAFNFFGGDNWELLVKVLDGCGHTENQGFWVFAAATTDIDITLTVTDTQSSESRVYNNPLAQPFQPIMDTQAFATCP